MTTTKPTYTLCDACRRPMRAGEPQRLIHGFSLHMDDECFYIYTVKVEQGILRTPFSGKKPEQRNKK